MTEAATASPSRGFRLWPGSPANPRDRYTEAALERHKREGQELAVKARWIAMALIAVLLVYLNPHWDVLYYHGILALIAFNGWLMRRVGQVERSRAELALIFLDLLIMTVGMVVPNPFANSDMPLAMQYRLDYFLYFFVILAAGTLAFSWRTVIVMGVWTAGMWAVALAAVWWYSDPVPGLSDAAAAAFAGHPGLTAALDPNSLRIELRIQEIVVFVLVAGATLISVLAGWPGLWAAAVVVLGLHFVAHIAQFLVWRGYVPVIVTSVPGLIWCIWALGEALERGMVSLAETWPWVLFGVPVTAVWLYLAHRLAHAVDRWLRRRFGAPAFTA